MYLVLNALAFRDLAVKSRNQVWMWIDTYEISDIDNRKFDEDLTRGD